MNRRSGPACPWHDDNHPESRRECVEGRNDGLTHADDSIQELMQANRTCPHLKDKCRWGCSGDPRCDSTGNWN